MSQIPPSLKHELQAVERRYELGRDVGRKLSTATASQASSHDAAKGSSPSPGRDELDRLSDTAESISITLADELDDLSARLGDARTDSHPTPTGSERGEGSSPPAPPADGEGVPADALPGQTLDQRLADAGGFLKRDLPCLGQSQSAQGSEVATDPSLTHPAAAIRFARARDELRRASGEPIATLEQSLQNDPGVTTLALHHRLGRRLQESLQESYEHFLAGVRLLALEEES